MYLYGPPLRAVIDRSKHLHHGFLRGEPRREVLAAPPWIGGPVGIRTLVGREDAVEIAVSEALDRLRDGVHRTQIGPDPDVHERARRPAIARSWFVDVARL